MDPDSLKHKSNVPRKVRFAPKAPIRRASKSAVAKTEVVDDADTSEAKELLSRFNDGLAAGKTNVERKSTHSQVAFGFGASAIPQNYTVSVDANKLRSQGLKGEKDYKEPWNYYSYYPVTLPLRRPYSGNPGLLDAEEFGHPLESTTFDESTTKPATELGLMDENHDTRMMLLQLPLTMPMIKQSAVAASQQKSGSTNTPSSAVPVEKTCHLNELPPGLMGKMLVYKSGAVKLKLGDTLYDVTPGSDCAFAQDVVAINMQEKHCCVVGELNKHATVTPDVDFILNSMPDLG
ncbi:hypothetical protein Ancab_027549 [Ancistrocladus abbreviatus]